MRAGSIALALALCATAVLFATPAVSAAPPCIVGYSYNCVVQIVCVMECCGTEIPPTGPTCNDR